jgi:hypothetical protein
MLEIIIFVATIMADFAAAVSTAATLFYETYCT